MIIQCKKCGTKYRFDTSLIDGEGKWVRCTRCEDVFFQENPAMEEVAPLTTPAQPEEEIHEKPHKESAEDIDRIFDQLEPADDMQAHNLEDDGGFDDIDKITIYPDAPKVENAPKSRLSGWKIVISLILIILLSGGIYLWNSPQVTKMIVDRISPQVEKFIAALPEMDKIIGTKSKDISNEDLAELSADLINVKERFAKNWVAGNIMVVEGTAVNNNKYSVSHIRVRGKILDSSGNILVEEESNCGNILTDVELKGLTEKEIIKELSNPYGREVSNTGIEPGAGVPFMLAMVMPGGDAKEFLVELAGIEIADN